MVRVGVLILILRYLVERRSQKVAERQAQEALRA